MELKRTHEPSYCIAHPTKGSSPPLILGTLGAIIKRTVEQVVESERPANMSLWLCHHLTPFVIHWGEVILPYDGLTTVHYARAFVIHWIQTVGVLLTWECKLAG